jgi:acetolactate synthase-1/2/3 large subunit
MRVADYIAKRLQELGVKQVYGLTGGGASGLNDGFIKNKNIKYICFHHEQGAGHAAVGESKVTKKISVVNPTTGCGGTNCITSLLDAWQDSLPVVFISGNVRIAHTTHYINKNKNVSIRKYGIQEHNIISTVQSITKYAKFIEKAEDVPYELDFAINEALSGRMGPVWLDIPSDVQHAEIPLKYKEFKKITIKKRNTKEINIKEILSKYSKPLILAGYGITLSNTQKEFRNFIEKYQIPFVTTYLGIDIIEYSHNLNMGTIGIKGSRAGNFAIQNCDLLLIIGCSLNCSHTGYDESLFSPKSYKIMVDIDKNEFKKETIKINEFINIDIKDFLNDYK